MIKAISITYAAGHCYHVNIVKEIGIKVPACEYLETMIRLECLENAVAGLY
jgi:hypothetical protein